jgi:hypothetical protein
MDIETPSDSFLGSIKGTNYPIGTPDNSLTGDVSEVWVAAALWDLADGTQDSRSVGLPIIGTTYTDTISNSTATFASLKNLKTTTHNRGGPDLTLVDFLGQWLCTEHSKWGTKKAKENESTGKLFAAFLQRTDESTLGRAVVETVVLLTASRGNASHVLREAAEFYRADVAAITAQAKQEFASKEKAKATEKAAPKLPVKAAARPAKRTAA